LGYLSSGWSERAGKMFFEILIENSVGKIDTGSDRMSHPKDIQF